MSRKISPVDLENAVADYVAGGDLDGLARRYHTTDRSLKAELAGRGLLRTPQELSALRSRRGIERWAAKDAVPAAEIVQRYLAGESQKSLSDDLGVNRSAIRSRLERAGIEVRGNAVANRLMMAARTPEEHAANTVAAHAAARGRKATFEERCTQALSRERNRSGVSSYERQFAAWLVERGLAPTVQKAVGPYNLDLAVHPVAVEIFGGHWHASGRHAERARKRFEHILDAGWSVVVVWVNRRTGGLSRAAADYVVAHLERTRRDPTLLGQYGVIRGDGQPVAAFSCNLDNLTRVPPLEGGFD